MPKLAPLHYRKLVKVFESYDFVLERQEGDHLIYIKAGIKRPVVIPMYRAVPVFIISNNLKTADISRAQYFRFFKK